MNKHFSYKDRMLPIRFFDENPITITFTISEETDRKIDTAVKQFDKTSDPKVKRKILTDLIGEEKLEELLKRADQDDSFAVEQVFYYINHSYVRGKHDRLLLAANGGAAPMK